MQKIKQNRIQLLVLLLIVAVHVTFIANKEGYHMDELISFELANAEYNPWIVPTQPQGRLAKFMQEEIDGETFGETVQNFVNVVRDVLENKGSSKLLTYTADVYAEPVWIEREDFEAYVTTGQRDRFNLLSVYFNVKDDNHPPVHFMLLHLISSLFPGVVSVWMGCFINICALLGICICMMKGGTLLEKHQVLPAGAGKLWGLFAAALYGCSAGAIATTLLMRMYGVMTFFCVLTLYLHVKKWLEGSFDQKNKGLIAVTVLGFLTQYFFLFYCILLAAVTFVLLLVYRRKKEAFVYVRTMILSAVIGVCIFPFAVADVLSSGRGVEALQNLGGSPADFVQRIFRFGQMVLERCLGGVWPGLVLFIVVAVYGIWCLRKSTGRVAPLIWVLLLPPVGYFLMAAKMSPMFVDRYIMAVFPFVAMTVALVLVSVTSLRVKGGLWLHVGVLAVLCLMPLTYDGAYLYEGYEKQLKVSREYEHLPCICLYEGSGYYDNLLEFVNYDKTLLVTPGELIGRNDTRDVEELQEVVIIKKGIVEETQLQLVLKQYDWEIEEVLIDKGACNDTVYLCRRIVQ